MAIAKTIEVSSESTSSFEDAAGNAIKEASKTIKNIKHLWVKDFEINVQEDGSYLYRTACKITFVVNDGMDA